MKPQPKRLDSSPPVRVVPEGRERGMSSGTLLKEIIRMASRMQANAKEIQRRNALNER